MQLDNVTNRLGVQCGSKPFKHSDCFSQGDDPISDVVTGSNNHSDVSRVVSFDELDLFIKSFCFVHSASCAGEYGNSKTFPRFKLNARCSPSRLHRPVAARELAGASALASFIAYDCKSLMRQACADFRRSCSGISRGSIPPFACEGKS